MSTISDDEEVVSGSWTELDKGQPMAIIAPVRGVPAIVISQDCDSAWGVDISLCEIKPFEELETNIKTDKIKSIVKVLTKYGKDNLKYFYLPPDDRNFKKRMGVDFEATLRLKRDELEQFRAQRIARLNPVALAHFGSRLGHYFTRYPVDEWYCLSDEELATYMAQYPDIKPYSWQNAKKKD